MVELKVYLSDGLNEKFRKIAMAVYGYGRGSLSKAAEEAFAKWCMEHVALSSSANQSGGAQTGSLTLKPASSGVNPDERLHGSEKRDTVDNTDSHASSG